MHHTVSFWVAFFCGIIIGIAGTLAHAHPQQWVGFGAIALVAALIALTLTDDAAPQGKDSRT